MQITRTKKALVAVIALVLVGIFVAVAAVYLPSAENSSAFKDNTVADSGSGADTVSTVSASSTAPSEDGTVPEGYQTTCTDEITSIEDIRGTSGSYYLTGNIDVLSLDTSGKTFSGTLDGNGKTITIRATALNQEDVLTVGGLFSVLSGTVKNLNIVVETFSFSTRSSGQRNIGIIAGTLSGGTVDNVKIELKYSPSGNDPSQGIGNVQAYFFDSGQHSGKSLDTFFGGVAGSSVGGTIKNTTVHNATSGNYGVSIVTANKKPTLGSASSDNAVGLFIGCATSGTTNLTNIRVIENSDSKIGSYFYQASHDKRSLIGVVWGWGWSESTFNVDGVIYDNTIDFDRYTNYAGNQGIGTQHAGSMNGWHEGGISVKNVFAPEEMTWLDGADDTIRGTIYTEDKVVAFDDNNTDNIIVKATFANPTEEAITSSVTVGNSTTSVLQALTVGDGETASGTTAYVSVKKSTQTLDGTNSSITYVNATKGTMNLGGASFTENRDEGYYAAREYDGNAEAARSISLSTGKTIDDVYVDSSGLGKNVGLHTLAFNTDALGSDYKLVSYAGVNYIVGNDGYVYSPDNISINSEQSVIDVTKNQIVEITPRAITVGKASGNITYGDTVETVQLNNIPEATSGSLVGGEYVESCTISDYVQFEINAGSEDAFTYTAVVIKDASGADVTANYNVTYGAGTAVVKQKTIAGALSVADLVYANAEKVAVFTAEEGMGLFNDDAVEITYSGDRQNVTETGFAATATVPKYDDSNSNYTFESGASISETFKITPYEVAITVNDEATTEYEYSGVVPNSVLLTLFNAPEGLAGETLFLNFAAFINDEEATVNYVGTYTVRATLAESYVGEDEEIVSQANYTAASCDATITIKAKEINVSLSDVENSKTYDGAVVGDDYLQTMFVVDGEVAEGHVAELKITVAEGEIKNAGVYNISVALPSHYDIMYAISATSTTQTTYTVGQVVIDGEISAPEDSVYDGSEKFATFVFAEGCEMVGSDEIILTYATQGGQGVTQVVSAGTYTVSAALPAFAAGKSNYKWASDEIATKDIVIEKAPVTIQKVEDVTAEYNGVEFVDYASLFTAPLAVDGITDLVLSYSVGGAAETIVNVGEYTVTAALADNGTNANYEAAEAVVTYTVTPVTVEIIWSENNYAYTGDVQTVSAKYAAVGGEEVDLAVSFGDGVEFRNAGDYLATASFAEGDNEYGNYVLPEVATNTYNIKKADSVIDTENVVKTYTYTGELQTIDSGATLNHSEAELVYSNNTFTTVAEGNGMEVVISVADTANYNGASTTVQITVNKATPAFTVTVEPTEGLFTSSEMPSITADFGENPVVEGVIVWDTDELTAGANAYGWTFTPVDTANYNVVTGSETLVVAAVEMTRIEIKTQPSKVTYEYGDKFDKTGMIVEAVYNDGSREIVEDYTVADAYLTTLGENQIEVTYNEMTATVTVTVEAKEFAIAYSDLTVVAGSEDFDLTSIVASIVGTEGNTVNVAGQSYPYTVSVAYTDTDGAYSSADPVDTTYALTVTVNVEGLDAQYYVGTYEATLRVIATSMEGSWTSKSVTAEYDGNTHEAEFTVTKGGEFEIQYAVSGTDVWSTQVPVNAGEYVAKVVSLDEGYSADRLPTATVTINKKSVVISAVSGTVSADYNGTAFADYASLFNAPSGVNDEGALELAFTVTKDGEPAEILGAGTYTVTATLANVDGNYTAEACEVTYNVAPAEVSVNWTGSSSVVYSGEAYEPTFEATGLVGDDQLTVTYQAKDGSALTGDKARNAGSYTATAVLPNANYVFAAETVTTFDFAIEKVKVSFSALLDGNTKYVEYGGEYTPSVDDFYTTSVANSELFEFYIRWSLEFDLSGIATANAGTKYEAAVEGVVRYAGGEDIAEADYSNFELTGDIADIVVYVEVIAKKINVTATDASATYDGEKVSVDELLAMFGLGDIDANVTVNDKAYDEADITDVGSYNVVVASADENYEFIGDTDATFTVNAADMTAVTVTGYSGEYDKTAHGAVVNASATTVDGSVVTFVYATEQNGVYGDAPEFTYAGEYTVWYKATAANHNEAAGSFTVTIAKAVVDLPEIASKAYNGETQTATVAESDLYTVTTNDGGINAGNYYVEIELNDKDNYAWVSDEDGDGVIEAEWSIVKATPTVNPVVPETVFRGTRLRNISIELGEGDTPGTIEWKNPNYVLEADENVCDWIFTPTDTDNYDTLEGSVTLIGKYVIVTHIEILQTPDKLVYEYGDELDITGLRARTVYNNGATGIIDNSDMYLTFSPTKMTQLGTVTVTIKYHSYTEKFDVTVNKKEISVNWTGADSAVYSGEAYEPAFENTALIGEDKMSVTYEATTGALTEGKAVNAGSYTATAVLPSENYVFADDTASTFDFTIDTVKISATFVGSNVDVVYGGVYGWNIADFYKDATIVNSDDFTVEFGFASSDDLSAISTADKGTVFNASLAVIIKNKAGETVPDEDPNFEVVDGESYSMDLTVTVIAKKINLTATDASAVYDGEKVAKSELLAMFGLSEDTGVVVKVGGVAYDDAAIANAGEYVVTVEEANANYEVTGETSAKYVVTAKQLTVVWGALSFEYDGEEKLPTATVDTGIDGESVEIIVSGAATELGKYTATASMKDVNPNYTLVNTQAQFEIVRTAIVAQFTVGYGEITVVSENDDAIEYSVNDGAWTVLPEDGKIEVELAASWTIKLRYVGATVETEHVIYTTANNVALYLEANLSEEALENKAVIDTAKSWLATAVGDKTDAEAMIAEAENKYNAAKDTLADSVENAFKATANVTGRTVTAIVALSTAVTGLGLAAGIIAIRRKGGKKNENK